MGAHTLGEAHFGNSGFSGTWVSNEQVWQGLIKHPHECYTVNILQFYFNNQYYTNLVNTSLDWQLEQSSCGTSVNNSVTNRDNVDNKSGNVDTSTGNVDTNIRAFHEQERLRTSAASAASPTSGLTARLAGNSGTSGAPSDCRGGSRCSTTPPSSPSSATASSSPPAARPTTWTRC